MFPSGGSGNSASGSTGEQSGSHQEWLSHGLHRLGLFSHRKGKGREPDWTASEAETDGLQNGFIQPVQPHVVYLIDGEGEFRIWQIDSMTAMNLGIVSDSSQKPVGDSRSAA